MVPTDPPITLRELLETKLDHVGDKMESGFADLHRRLDQIESLQLEQGRRLTILEGFKSNFVGARGLFLVVAAAMPWGWEIFRNLR